MAAPRVIVSIGFPIRQVICSLGDSLLTECFDALGRAK